MKGHFTHNHYVPVWYQKRFLPNGQSKFFYHDLNPETRTAKGKTWTRDNMLRWGPKKCFAQDDLYTVQWGALKNTDIEQFFFGQIDTTGREAVEFFDNFDIKDGVHEAFENLVRYMSTQKLRTPKGLGFLSQAFRKGTQFEIMRLLQQHQIIFGTLWTEAVWHIADATNSPTKFIVSDHPVTVYNRRCFPGSRRCRGFNDPDIREVGTHTIFPLSLDKILILTNLAWVRNPYQHEMNLRPNPTFYHPTMMMLTKVQQGRSLSEQEVREINYIIKKRALQWVAAGEEEWLFPERFLPSTHWNKFGNGYLLMPEPRDIHMGGEIVVGYKDGSAESFGEYGHRPGQNGFKDDKRFQRESASLRKFQAEFALLQGKAHRGWSNDLGNKGPRTDSDDFYEYVVSAAAENMRSKHRK